MAVMVCRPWDSRGGRSRSIHVVYLYIIISKVRRKKKENIPGVRDPDVSRAPLTLLLLPLSFKLLSNGG